MLECWLESYRLTHVSLRLINYFAVDFVKTFLHYARLRSKARPTAKGCLQQIRLTWYIDTTYVIFVWSSKSHSYKKAKKRVSEKKTNVHLVFFFIENSKVEKRIVYSQLSPAKGDFCFGCLITSEVTIRGCGDTDLWGRNCGRFTTLMDRWEDDLLVEIGVEVVVNVFELLLHLKVRRYIRCTFYTS